MIENTNKSIVVNSLIMTIRLAIVTICGLLTTRFALQALGITDFGLFALIGSIITFASVFNQIMLNTSNRFISVAIGKGDEHEINVQFNINLLIHVGIAICTLILGLPFGHWYILHFVNFDGDIQHALMVYDYSLIGSVISFIGVPYNGLLIAKEKFIIFSSADVITHIFKTAVAFSLLYYFADKLMVYALSQCILTAAPTILYIVYCKRHYPSAVSPRLVRDRQRYKEVFSFSSWVAFGAFITIGQTQGAALIVNMFFNTVMNAALGIANTINMLVTQFSYNISQPIAPQITKSYAAGDLRRCEELLIMSTKFTYLAMLFVAAPFLVDSHWILSVWLSKVPPFSVSFTILVVVNTLVFSLNSGIGNIIFASGKIALYQILNNTLRALSVIIAFIILHNGCQATAIFYVYIASSALILFANQWVLRKELKFNTAVLFWHSYLPSIIVTVCFLPVCFIRWEGLPLLHLIVTMLYLTLLIGFFGLSRKERSGVVRMITERIKK